MTEETQEQRLIRKYKEDFNDLHPIHQQVIAQADELMDVLFKSFNRDDPNYWKLTEAVNQLIICKWRDGYWQALSTHKPDLYNYIMTSKATVEDTEE